jgi:hypothetical protein
MVWMAQDFEYRVRELLENEEMIFRWDLYFPWYFLADLGILAAIVAALVWWFR